MEVKYERCCGIDVHKKSIVACVIVPGAEGQLVKITRSFGTMSDDLLDLSAWLKEHGVTTVALEATGVFWKPVFNLLDGQFDHISIGNLVMQALLVTVEGNHNEPNSQCKDAQHATQEA